MFEELIDLTSSFLVIFRNITKKHLITPSQGFIILAVDMQGSPMTVLSKKMGLDASTMTRNIEKLEKNQLVFRQRLSSDARIINVYLTESGKRLGGLLRHDLEQRLNHRISDKTEIADKLHGLIWDLEKINNIE
jgi:DNA-binding MarR family transcriptional regulator